MNSAQRSVTFSTIINILKKRPIAIFFAVIFAFFALLMATIFTLVFSLTGNDMPKVDYELIDAQGIETTAEISNIETDYTVTVNGLHPTVISYQYIEDGQAIESEYKVLEEVKVEALAAGDDITIKSLNGQSVIKNIKPYHFPTTLFFLAPIPFLLFGLPFLLYIIVTTSKELKLYKYGQVKSARIVSIMPKYTIPFISIGQGVKVHYEYETGDGNKIVGESVTSDFSIISDKRTGDTIPIFVEPDNEYKSCVVPKLDALKNNWHINFE